MSKVIENLILSHPKDNVATAKSPIKSGTSLTISKGKKIIAKEEIPFAHKIALRRIPKDGAVVKYGERIGRAIREIKPGELVHIHNVVGERGRSKGRKKVKVKAKAKAKAKVEIEGKEDEFSRL